MVVQTMVGARDMCWNCFSIVRVARLYVWDRAIANSGPSSGSKQSDPRETMLTERLTNETDYLKIYGISFTKPPEEKERQSADRGKNVLP